MTVPVAFDPKWAQVVALSFLEGPNGQTVVAGERGANFTLINCAVSTGVSRWSRGSVFFPSDAAARNIPLSGITVLTSTPQVIQGSFYAVDVAGDRAVMSAGDRILMSIVNGTLTLRIRSTAESTPEYTITMAGISIEQWYDYAIRLHETGASLEVNQSSVGAVSWGSETHASGVLTPRLGNNTSYTAVNSFRGYLGPFRWTIGDRRLEDAGRPAYRFPVLAAVDSFREKVIFHSRFEGANNAMAAVDTKGKTITFAGTSRLETGTKAFGVSSFRANGGTGLIAHTDFQFGADDFTIEWFGLRSANSGAREYVLSLMDASDTDHALSFSAIYNHIGYLRINGVDVATAANIGPSISWLHYALVRKGADIAIFRNGSRVLTYSIGSASINSNGKLHCGKGGPVAPGNVSAYDYIDELRITRGAARYDPAMTSIVAPTEFFSEYGPRALSGHVLDHDGTPVQCTVRCYHAASGRLVSESVSDVDGSFVLPTADLTEHFWTAHHPTKNALIFDHIQPALVE